MRLVYGVLLSMCMITSIYAYTDYDVDGVEDSIDECPNTPFDILVDERGCEEGTKYVGEFTLFLGTLSAIDRGSENITNLQLFANYRYHDWDISLSAFNDVKNAIENVPNTYYITTGYRFKPSKSLQTKISLGTKQSSAQNDYYITSNIDYSMSEKQNLFLFYSYTIAQDSSTNAYDNFHTLSVGTGRILTDYWYAALSYDFSGASLEGSEDYQALTWSNTIVLNASYFLLATYSYGLSDAASDHTIGIQFGVKFE